jgi:polyisoprenoid-binding protein YceI
MKTGDSNRDTHMMEALGFPEENEIKLEILKSEPEQEKQKYKIDFAIKIKGITKELSTIAEVKETENGISVAGSFTIQLDMFRVEPPKLLFIKLNNDVQCNYKFILNVEK